MSFHLKKKHPEMKRNFKFDDAEQDLVLDFSIDPDGGAPWRKVRPSQAKVIKERLAKKSGAPVEVTSDELVKILDDDTGFTAPAGSFTIGAP